MTVDVASLKTRIDLVELIGRDVPLRRVASTAGGEWAGPCPFCGGRDRLRVQRRRWWCRRCSSNEHWFDVIEYVRRRDGCTFGEACSSLGASASELDSTSREQSLVAAEPQVEQLPHAGWQTASRLFVERAIQTLWSDRGARARAYLEGRGLRPETLRNWRIGYQPRDAHEPAATWALEGRDLWLPHGIVLPWQIGTDLWTVKVKRPPPLKPPYWAIRGSVPVLFGADMLLPGEVVVLVESELDAILICQETGDAPVVAVGGARRSLGLRALQALLQSSQLLLCYDADVAGDAASEALQQVVRGARRIRPPDGKDPTAYWQAGGDVRSWILAEFDHQEAAWR
jgi:DNA primase